MSLCDADMQELLRLARLGQRAHELQQKAVQLGHALEEAEFHAAIAIQARDQAKANLTRCLAELKDHFDVIKG